MLVQYSAELKTVPQEVEKGKGKRFDQARAKAKAKAKARNVCKSVPGAGAGKFGGKDEATSEKGSREWRWLV